MSESSKKVEKPGKLDSKGINGVASSTVKISKDNDLGKNTVSVSNNNLTSSNSIKQKIDTTKDKSHKNIQLVNQNNNLKESKSEKNVPLLKPYGSKQSNIIPLSTKNEGTKPKIFQNIQVNLKSTSPKAASGKKPELKK